MSREDDFRTRMIADATLMATLTGGVYTYASLGRAGLTRDAVSAAYDTAGFLRPCAIVKQRANIPDQQVIDFPNQVASAVQIVETWLYEDDSYTAIDTAVARLFTLFFGYQFADTWEIVLVGGLDRQPEEGQLKGASMARLDFQVNSLMGQTS